MYCVIFVTSYIYSVFAEELNLTLGRDLEYLSDTDDEFAISDSSASGTDSGSDTDAIVLQMEEEDRREEEKEALEMKKWLNFTVTPVPWYTKKRIRSTYSWSPPTIPPTTKLVPKLPEPEPRGTFYDFVARLCHTLITRFSSRKLKKYMTLLGRSLRGLGDGYYLKKTIKRFIRRLKRIAKLKSTKMRKKVHSFLWSWRETRPHKNNFIQALNNMYTTSQYLYLQDYLFSMRKYADNYIKSIDTETRKVFRKWIFGSYYHLKEETQNMIQFRFKLAMLENIKERRKKIKLKQNHKRLRIGRLQD